MELKCFVPVGEYTFHVQPMVRGYPTLISNWATVRLFVAQVFFLPSGVCRVYRVAELTVLRALPIGLSPRGI